MRVSAFFVSLFALLFTSCATEPAPSTTSSSEPASVNIEKVTRARPAKSPETASMATTGGPVTEAMVDAAVSGRAPAAIDVSAARQTGPRPRVLFTAPPRYPMELRRAGVQGEALIDVVVGDDGHVRETRVIRATHPRFGEAAVECIRTWRYEAGKGEARLQVPINFTLKE